MGIDNNAMAILIAKSDARLNKIHGVAFRFADIVECDWPANTNVITANLYSDLLIEILPKISTSGWLILSGILRSQ